MTDWKIKLAEIREKLPQKQPSTAGHTTLIKRKGGGQKKVEITVISDKIVRRRSKIIQN